MKPTDFTERMALILANEYRLYREVTDIANDAMRRYKLTTQYTEETCNEAERFVAAAVKAHIDNVLWDELVAKGPSRTENPLALEALQIVYENMDLGVLAEPFVEDALDNAEYDK